jgi:hypothetical protein
MARPGYLFSNVVVTYRSLKRASRLYRIAQSSFRLCVNPGVVNKRRQSTKVILAALKIEMGHPHITASANAALYPERQDSLKPTRVPIRRSNIANLTDSNRSV